jgi:hypothetical protein
MEPIAYCSRCRGMRVGWNGKYILHHLICQEMLFRSVKLLVFSAVLSSLIFAFPVATGFVLSDFDPIVPSDTPIVQATLVPLMDPGIGAIDQLLAKYSVSSPMRGRIARAIVQSSRQHNIDPKLVASIMIVESGANPFAISGSDAVGIMQIHLPTWGKMADKEDINLFRIEDNVGFGVRILKDYVRRYGMWDGVKRYKGWNDNPDSHQKADDYAAKVRRIFEPGYVPPAPPAPAAETATQ